MAIIGAILGDIAGSQYEFSRPNDLDWKHCELFTDRCYFTDDNCMFLIGLIVGFLAGIITLAIISCLMVASDKDEKL